MSRTRGFVGLMVVALTLLTACGSSSSGNASTSLKHIFFIMMENQGYKEVIGNTADAPYINSLANTYGVATQFYGVTHPSLPNYLATVSGDFQGIYDDCKAGASITCPAEEFVSSSTDFGGAQLLTPDEETKAAAVPHLFSGQNIVDQIETHNMTWKAYFQSMPSVGYTGEYSPIVTNADGSTSPIKLYAQKHNPFIYFSDIANNPARMQNLVPDTQLTTDLNNNTVPNFVWISPDQCHDMHGVSTSSATKLGIPGCSSVTTATDTVEHSQIALGDQYINGTVLQIMKSKAWSQGSAIVIEWDEDDYSGYAGCCSSPVGLNNTTLGGANAPMIVITSRGAKHVSFTTPANHYSTLATIEKLWSFPCLANACNIKSSDLETPLFQP
jgi:phosphatidylinositol-3-phosphatase